MVMLERPRPRALRAPLHILLLALCPLLLAPGCGQRTTVPAHDGGGDSRPIVDLRPDGSPGCDPSADYDTDGIDNGEEGCLYGRDSDSDGILDWQDFDSDGDGIPDMVEAGEAGHCVGKAQQRWPCDSDADDVPDYLDVDSDGDGILDRDEDVNGDGLLGCCLVECGKPQGAQVSSASGQAASKRRATAP